MSKEIYMKICEASANNDVSKMKGLLNTYPGFDMAHYYQEFMQPAVENDAADTTSFLLTRGANANPSVYNPNERSLLMSALYYTANDSAMVLIDKGADLAARGPDGYPLHYAVRHGASREVLLKMIEKGADMNAAVDFYGSPLDCARASAHSDALEVFEGIIQQEKLAKLEKALTTIRNGLPYDLPIQKPFKLLKRKP